MRALLVPHYCRLKMRRANTNMHQLYRLTRFGTHREEVKFRGVNIKLIVAG